VDRTVGSTPAYHTLAADDWCVIAITDANFERYGITEVDLKRVMNSDPKVHTAVICIGNGADAAWYPF
jgi:hypothetical protein